MSDLTIDALFLNAEDIKDGDKVTFIDPGRRTSKEETGLKEDTFEITIKLPNSELRKWTMNKTSQRMAARQLGMDNKKWVDKIVVLKKVQQMVGKEMKDCIYIEGSEPKKKDEK